MKNHHRVLAGAGAALVLAAGASRANAPAGRYVVSADLIAAYDTKTKLTWERQASGAIYYWWNGTMSGTAQSYCATAGLPGTGWRVPTVKELQTLVDYSQAGGSIAMIDPTAFPSAQAEIVWASSHFADGPAYAGWYVNFSNGATSATSEQCDVYSVRCVR